MGKSKRSVTSAASSSRRGPALTATQDKVVKALINKKLRGYGEMHHYDNSSNLTMNTTGSLVSITAIGQGDTDITRSGDSIKPHRLHFNFNLYGNASGNTAINRIMIVQWRMDDANDAPTIAQVLESVDIKGYQNWDDKRKANILYDRTFITAPTTANPKYMYHVRRTLSGKRLSKIQYDNAATTGLNNIYALGFSDQATNVPQCNIKWRVEFKD